ncbi:MAG: putative toxin-antitoxin system toxin component, PIN family, partial [Chloroflexi bacterium]|nr:putative toxin-antitoxin system toxin component, PIN family [Chloroflexota bacterium]
TNVLVSRFLSPRGSPARILEQWERQSFDLVVSEALLEEYRRALLYPRVAAHHGLSPEEVAGVIDGVRQAALIVNPGRRIDAVARDPADNRILECAVAGEAEYVVSGDAHLLDIGEFEGIQILPPKAFLAVLDAEI